MLNDEIKYKLDRLSLIQSGYISGWKTKKESFVNRSKNNQRLNDRERNPTMAICGGAIPILLTIFSFEHINFETLISLLIIDTGIMFGIFVFYGIYNYKNTVVFVNIESVLLESIDNMESLKAHIDSASFNIKQFNDEKLDAIYAITKLTQYDSNLRYGNVLKESIKSKTFHEPTKVEFKKILGSSKNIISENIEYYNKVKEIVKNPEWKMYSYLYNNLKRESEKSKIT